MQKFQPNFMLTGGNTAFFFHHSESSLSQPDNNYLPQEDTTRTRNIQGIQPQNNSSPASLQIPNAINITDNYSQSQLDSLFERSEKREQQIASSTAFIPVKKETIKLPLDTISTKYNSYNFPVSKISAPVHFNEQNFLVQIPNKTYTLKSNVKVNVKSSINLTNNTTIISNKNHVIESKLLGNVRFESGMNWLVIILLFSLFIFSWLRIIYQKFIIQIIGSVVNYQLSSRLFRERNVLFKNVSFGLNFIFAVNLGLFTYFIIDYFDYKQIVDNQFFCTCIYVILILTIYAFKSVYCKFIGYVFLVQDEFDEYLHNINLFNKNIGLLLFPVVVVYPFINETIQPVILYTGMILISIMIILRMHRGLQIIIKKGIPFFYLILYLCAVEILPVLLLLKFTGVLS